MQSNRKMKKLGSRDENGVSKQSILSAMDRFVSAVDNMNETVMVPSRLLDMAADDNADQVHQPRRPKSMTTTTTTITSPNERSAPPSLNSISSSITNSNSNSSVDLFAFYNMLNTAKNELLWGNQGSVGVVKNGGQQGCRGNIENNNIVVTDPHRSLPSMTSLSGPTSMMVMGSLNGPSSMQPSSLNGSINGSVRSRRLSITSSMSLSDDSEADTESLSESDSGLEYDERSSNAARNFRHHLNGLYKALQELTCTADVLTGRYQDEVGGAS